MSKNETGDEINKSVKTISALMKSLDEFHKAPLKDGLSKKDIDDKEMLKMINETLSASYELKTKLEDLKSTMQGLKPKSSNRFASHRVLLNFLKSSSGS
jgi:phosphoglycerate-specific signal transduction histidine kinase